MSIADINEESQIMSPTSSNNGDRSSESTLTNNNQDHPKQLKHYCRTCNRLIVDECYIQCTLCKGYCQCLECFSVGEESFHHLKTHPIVIMEPETKPIFTSDWNAEEELLLLKSYSLCGNWADSSLQFQTKTPKQCESHYRGVYLSVKSAPMPEIEVKDPFPFDPPLPFSTEPQESCPSCGHDKILMLAGKKEKSTPAEFCGYMPKRHEFEEEFEDEAEHIIDSIGFDETDTYQTLEDKLTKLERYNSILNQRTFRTRVIEDWGIQDLQFKSLGGTTPRQKDVDQKLMTLAPYIGKEITIDLANKLHEMDQAVQQINKLQRWQENGIKTRAEGELFTKLQGFTKDWRVIESDVGKWNKAISDYQLEHSHDNMEDTKLLSRAEIDFCSKWDLPPPKYTAMKDLIMREYEARDGVLTREQVRALFPESADLIEVVYELILRKGWIV